MNDKKFMAQIEAKIHELLKVEAVRLRVESIDQEGNIYIRCMMKQENRYFCTSLMLLSTIEKLSIIEAVFYIVTKLRNPKEKRETEKINRFLKNNPREES